MNEETKLAEVVMQKTLGFSRADETDVLYTSGANSLTRFSENHIHQNVTERTANILVRVALGNKIGIASTNILSDDGIKDCVAQAYDIAKNSAPKDEYAGMPGPAEVKQVNSYDPETATYGAEQRAQSVGTIINVCKKAGMKAAGSFNVASGLTALANSHGVNVIQEQTGVEMTLVTSAENSSGYAEAGGWRVKDIDVAALAEDAVKRADLSRNPQQLTPGKYDVIIESYCIQEMMNWMSFVIFDTKAVLEGRSLLANRMGDRIFGENITITDDAYHPLIGGLTFDFEGGSRQKVTLVDKGIASGLCYDSVTAKMAGKSSTGHALPAGYISGPFPLYPVFSAGDSSIDKMIGSMERGLYITRFHYINGFVEPMQAVFTGMTRDGTFWVENGKIKHAVKNLRWTQSMLEAFSNVKMISKDVRVLGKPTDMMAVVPSMYITNFNVTGSTE